VFGLMLRGASNARTFPLLSAGVTSLAILAGGAAPSGLGVLSKTAVIAASLALACSSFLFLGGHIFVRQKRRAGMGSALAPLFLGLLVSAAVEQAVSTLLAQSH